MRVWAVFSLSLLLTIPVWAQRHFVTTDSTDDCATTLASLPNGGTPTNATKLPLSYFGVGIGSDAKRGGPDRIADAAVVGGKITTLDDDNVVMGPVLEAHALALTIKHDWAVRDANGRFVIMRRIDDDQQPCKAASEFPTIAAGPFTMLRLGDSEIIKSFGLGLMVGFRLKESESSLNVGVAYTRQQDVKTYASGFEEGNSLPTGETDIRYRNTDGDGIAVVVSFGW